MKCCKKPKGKISYDIPELESTISNFTDFEMDVLELVNAYRYEKGLQMLEFNFKLANIADPHTQYMVSVDTLSHDNFPKRNLQAIKYCEATWLGENVSFGYGTAHGFVQGWINSEGHRKILESDKAIFFAVSIRQNAKHRNYATLLLMN